MKKIVAFVAFLITAFTSPVFAWEPTKTVEITVPFPPGSGNDIVARMFADAFERTSNIKMIVINRAGAGGVVGTTHFKSLPNDGHYLNLISVGGIAAMDYTFDVFRTSNPPYAIDSFEYVTTLGYTPIVVIANIKDKVNNPKDLVNVLLTDPDATVAESGGAGRLGLESVLVNYNVKDKNPKLIRVTHAGPAESVNDIMGGHVRFATVPLSVAYPNHKTGNLKIVALTQQNKVPGIGVDGFKGLNDKIDAGLVWGIAMPKNTPKEIKEYWAAAFNKLKSEQKVREVFVANMFFEEPNYTTPEKFTKYVNDSYKNYSEIVNVINSMKK